jgi:predicted metal-dependent phosphoesterase TrpH
LRRFVDLHTHSSASDGSLTPAELVALADRRRLAAIALTDHDTVDGLAQARAAARQFPSLRLVGGVELSAVWPEGTMHLLGLGIDPTSPALRELVSRLRASRDERNPKMLARLRDLGMDITMDDLLPGLGRGPKPVIGRLHMAHALVRKGYVADVKGAFERYLGAGKPAYVDKERLLPAEAIELVHQAGGLVALAHPVQLGCRNRAQYERVVRSLKRQGLDGVEAYHSEHSDELTRMLLDLARRHGLGATGGSDFHGQGKPETLLGHPRVPVAGVTSPFDKLIS